MPKTMPKTIETTNTAQSTKYKTMSDVRAANKANGNYFFSRDSMRFFKSKIESGLYNGKYFITSEQFDYNSPRLYTVRSVNLDASINTIGDFQQYKTKSHARYFIQEQVKKDKLELNENIEPKLKPSHKPDYKKVDQYIINSICPENYGIDSDAMSDLDKLQFLIDTFKSEKQWHTNKVGFSVAFIEWMQGLPSAFNIVFTNYDIIQLAISWNSLNEDSTEDQELKIIENYWKFIANRFFILCRKNSIKY